MNRRDLLDFLDESLVLQEVADRHVNLYFSLKDFIFSFSKILLVWNVVHVMANREKKSLGLFRVTAISFFCSTKFLPKIITLCVRYKSVFDKFHCRVYTNVAISPPFFS